MYTPRINWFLFIFYLLAAVGVFIAALLFPSFRLMAYAPARELVMPPPEPVVVSVLYSTEKEAWLNEIITDFEAANPTVDGHPVQIELEKMGSWEINAAVLDGTRQPVIVSPASSLQIAAMVDSSTVKFGNPIVNPADSRANRSRNVFKTASTGLTTHGFPSSIPCKESRLPSADRCNRFKMCWMNWSNMLINCA